MPPPMCGKSVKGLCNLHRPLVNLEDHIPGRQNRQSHRPNFHDRELAPHTTAYLGSIGAEGGGAGATLCCCTAGGGGAGSLTPLMPSLKPFKPSPNPLPSSGSRLAPNSKNATTPSTTRCQG